MPTISPPSPSNASRPDAVWCTTAKTTRKGFGPSLRNEKPRLPVNRSSSQLTAEPGLRARSTWKRSTSFLDRQVLALSQLCEYPVHVCLGKSPQGLGSNVARGTEARQERRH